jgi:hypothetical protein
VGIAAFLAATVVFFIVFTRSLASPNLILSVLPILLIALLYYADSQWLKTLPPAQGDTVI